MIIESSVLHLHLYINLNDANWKRMKSEMCTVVPDTEF